MTRDDDALETLARRLGGALAARGERIAAAESCTGGWIAKVLTDVPGSSGWFDRGFVTYSDEAKSELLSVPAALIGAHGAVSEPVARAMAEGALRHSAAAFAVAVTGIAGPGGGTPEKPVGTVCFGWASRAGQCSSASRQFTGDRQAVRRHSVAHALEGMLACIEVAGGPDS
jgi:nicotinamide-nucleotide amidase